MAIREGHPPVTLRSPLTRLSRGAAVRRFAEALADLAARRTGGDCLMAGRASPDRRHRCQRNRMGEELIDAAGDRSDVLALVAAVSRSPGTVSAEAAVGTHLARGARRPRPNIPTRVVDFTVRRKRPPSTPRSPPRQRRRVRHRNDRASRATTPTRLHALDAAARDRCRCSTPRNFSRRASHALRGVDSGEAAEVAAGATTWRSPRPTTTGSATPPAGTALTLIEDVEDERREETLDRAPARPRGRARPASRARSASTPAAPAT